MVNIGQEVRLRDFIADDGKSLILDCTSGLMGENQPNLAQTLTAIKGQPIDGIILSPGAARKYYRFFNAKQDPALIVKCDWSNFRLDEKSPYPRQQFRHVPICTVEEAMRLGASAVIIDMYYGVEDAITAEDTQNLRQWAGDGYEIGLPIIANIIPYGPRVTTTNFAEITSLGARMCLEVGATAVSIPVLSDEKIEFCHQTGINSPLFLHMNANPFEVNPITQTILQSKLKSQSITGIMLDNTKISLPIERKII
jgi:DhnA family fructose-bisphosphate aldolase class Ia